MANNTENLVSCWKRVGWSNGRISPGSISLNTYAVGTRYRDASLPDVNQVLLQALFSLENLIREPSAPNPVPVVRGADGRAQAVAAAQALVSTHAALGSPTSVITLSKTRDAAATMSSFWLTARMNGAGNMTAVTQLLANTELQADNVFGEAEEVLRGAAGRISTANGFTLFVSASRVLLQERRAANPQRQQLAVQNCC